MTVSHSKAKFVSVWELFEVGAREMASSKKNDKFLGRQAPVKEKTSSFQVALL